MKNNIEILENGIFLKKQRTDNFINTIDPVITDNCNLCCPHCWGFNNGQSLKLDNFIKILNISKKFGIENIQFTGGEPLLNKNIFDYAELSLRMNFKNRLRTNFAIKIFDEKFLNKILDNFGKIYISIDGLAETNFELRPTKEYFNLKNKNLDLFKIKAEENFNIIINNLKNLIKIKEKRNLDIKIIICSVIQRRNILEIKDIIEFFNNFKISSLDLTQVILEKTHISYISNEEFMDNIFKNLFFSKNIIKIKPFSNSRCIMCKTNGDIILAGYQNIKLGNYMSESFDNIENILSKKIENNYINYFYFPNNFLFNI